MKNEKNCQNIKGMFGNCFFPLFSVSKNNFLLLRQKNLFDNQNGQKTKIVLKTQFVKETENMFFAYFQFPSQIEFLVFKSQRKYAFNLINISHLMN